MKPIKQELKHLLLVNVLQAHQVHPQVVQVHQVDLQQALHLAAHQVDQVHHQDLHPVVLQVVVHQHVQ